MKTFATAIKNCFRPSHSSHSSSSKNNSFKFKTNFILSKSFRLSFSSSPSSISTSTTTTTITKQNKISSKSAASSQLKNRFNPCMNRPIIGKRKLSLPSFPSSDPIAACHVHTFAPLKRPRKEKMVNLLDLTDDVLITIMSHVMTPAKEGWRRIITEESIRASLPFATTCRTLYDIWRHSMHDLELWVSSNLDDRGLKAICKGNGRGIHRLGLRKCQKLSLQAFDAIPRHCTRLRSIDLSHTDINDDFILNLTKSTGRSLNFLAIHGCTKLTSQALHTIADKCPHLKFLDVGSVPAMNDETLSYIVNKIGGSIRTMVLSNCTNLTDDSMVEMGLKCKSLMSLTIRGLSAITDFGLQKLCIGIGEKIQILDVLDCVGLTVGGYFSTMETYCPHVFRYLEESNYVDHLGERCLRDNIIATMPGLIYRISATDAIRRLPALYFLLLDESTLRPFRVSVQSKSLNLSDFGTVLISNFGKRPTDKTRSVLLSRFGYDSPFDSESDDDPCDT